MAGVEFRLPGKEAVEDIDFRLGQNGAQVGTLHGTGDEVMAAARGPQRAAHRDHAEAIGIALDGHAASGRAGGGSQGLPVGLDGAEIDGEDGTGKIGGNGGLHGQILCFLHRD